MGKKSRRHQKLSNEHVPTKLKTRLERQQQVNNINQQLMNLQLDDRLPEMQTLSSIMELYVEKGESNCGKIPLSNSNKVIHFILSNRINVNCRVNICVVS